MLPHQFLNLCNGPKLMIPVPASSESLLIASLALHKCAGHIGSEPIHRAVPQLSIHISPYLTPLMVCFMNFVQFCYLHQLVKMKAFSHNTKRLMGFRSYRCPHFQHLIHNFKLISALKSEDSISSKEI